MNSIPKFLFCPQCQNDKTKSKVWYESSSGTAMSRTRPSGTKRAAHIHDNNTIKSTYGCSLEHVFDVNEPANPYPTCNWVWTRGE